MQTPNPYAPPECHELFVKRTAKRSSIWWFIGTGMILTWTYWLANDSVTNGFVLPEKSDAVMLTIPSLLSVLLGTLFYSLCNKFVLRRSDSRRCFSAMAFFSTMFACELMMNTFGLQPGVSRIAISILLVLPISYAICVAACSERHNQAIRGSSASGSILHNNSTDGTL